MKNEDKIRADYQATHAAVYQQAIQAGLPEDIATQMANDAVVAHAESTIRHILGPKLGNAIIDSVKPDK